ncbi:MAG TPA: hypothetical protein VNA20_04450 [Frankiaceae bacterium]|nr:hypothetical protein [Frankiaceae bacterium]
MRTITRAATLMAATSLAVAALAAPASADAAAPDGCVTDYLNGGGGYAIDLDAFIYYTVHVNPDGSITVNPWTPVGLAAFIAGQEAGQVVTLVTCIV